MDIAKLTPYKRQLRPSTPESLPKFLDGELRRIDTSSREIVEALQALDARLKSLGA